MTAGRLYAFIDDAQGLGGTLRESTRQPRRFRRAVERCREPRDESSGAHAKRVDAEAILEPVYDQGATGMHRIVALARDLRGRGGAERKEAGFLGASDGGELGRRRAGRAS